MSVIRHWPMQTEHGWIVGASVVDTDTDPTTFTRKGAEDLARLLNNSQGAVSRLEAWADDLMRYADTFDHSPEMVRAVAVEMRAVASGQSPRPARTSRTQALSVECPHCGAGPGEPCVGARDKPRTSMHRERHDALGRQR